MVNSETLTELNLESETQQICLSNPHPYPITLDIFNEFRGVDSSYYHRIKQSTPRFNTLSSGNTITIEDALFIQLLGGDIEVTDLDNNTTIIYTGENHLLEYGFNLTNNIQIRAINNPVSIIWTKAESFINDTAINPRGVCAIYFHPSTTDFYNTSLLWLTQDSFGNQTTDVLEFNEFNPYFLNNAYLLKLNKIVSSTDSFKVTLLPHSNLCMYLYTSKNCIGECQPCDDISIGYEVEPNDCEGFKIPIWLILLMIIGIALMVLLRYTKPKI